MALREAATADLEQAPARALWAFTKAVAAADSEARAWRTLVDSTLEKAGPFSILVSLLIATSFL